MKATRTRASSIRNIYTVVTLPFIFDRVTAINTKQNSMREHDERSVGSDFELKEKANKRVGLDVLFVSFLSHCANF